MDEIAKTNRERWNALVRAGVSFSRPWLNLDETTARQQVDPHGLIGDVKGKDVLCLAGAGGQQTVAFALMGANTTVLDLSDAMLERDRETVAKLGLSGRFEQGDMRDLSRFADHSFDVVWHAYSINFVPRIDPVLDEIVRVLRPGGFYRTEFHNPFVFCMDEDDWDGKGYPIQRSYINGMEADDTIWDVTAEDGTQQRIQGPREFRHTLSALINGLCNRKFILLGLWEETGPENGDQGREAEPGSWEHFMSFCAPWIQVWARLGS